MAANGADPLASGGNLGLIAGQRPPSYFGHSSQCKGTRGRREGAVFATGEGPRMIGRLVLALALALSSSIVVVKSAKAACPPGTSYQCYQGAYGKVICGCR